MAFVQLESWRAEAAPGGGSPLLGIPPVLSLPLRRAAALSFTAIVHCALLYVLVARLTDGTEVEDRPVIASLALYDLPDPGATGGAPAKPVEPTAAAAPPTLLDLSEPADLPPTEWSVTRMRVASPAETKAPGQATGFAAAGAGQGGGPRLSEFVGFGDGIGGQLLLDEPMLEAARLAALGALPPARGTALIFLRVAPSGVVTEAVVRGGSREMAMALRRELLGKKLFQVKSRIRESALVALPPLNLSAAS
jgi:hypothetical protein